VRPSNAETSVANVQMRVTGRRLPGRAPRIRAAVYVVAASVVLTLLRIPPALADDTASGALPSPVVLGPVVMLADWTFVDVSTYHDGRVHLVGGKYAPPSRFMYLAHMTVDGDGGVSEDPIASVPLVQYGLAAEFEASGVLHVTVDHNHYRRLETGWDGPTQGPACTQMILAAEKLLCTDRISAKEAGGKADLAKLLLSQQVGASWAPWRVVDRDDSTIIGGYHLVADGARGVHLLYAALGKIAGSAKPRAVGDSRVRYVRLPRETLAPPLPEFRPDNAPVIVPPLGGEEGVSRAEVPVLTEGVALAVDPESGLVLAASTYHQASKERYPLTYTIRDGVADAPSSVGDFAGDTSARIRLAPAGNDRFHVVIAYASGKRAQLGHLVYYLRSGNGWSRAVDLADSTSEIVAISTSLEVAADKGDAFVTWVDDKDKKARGRWVHVAN